MAALETFVRQYYFQAVRTSFLIVQDDQQAEDIVQEAFLHAYEKIHQLSSACFGPWFLKMVLNASLKFAEKHKKQLSLDAEDVEVDPKITAWLIDSQAIPEDLVESAELQQEVWKALQSLTPRQRTAIVMKYYLGMTETEITQLLRLPLSSIKWHLFAARKKLKGLLSSSSNELK